MIELNGTIEPVNDLSGSVSAVPTGASGGSGGGTGGETGGGTVVEGGIFEIDARSIVSINLANTADISYDISTVCDGQKALNAANSGNVFKVWFLDSNGENISVILDNIHFRNELSTSSYVRAYICGLFPTRTDTYQSELQIVVYNREGVFSTALNYVTNFYNKATKTLSEKVAELDTSVKNLNTDLGNLSGTVQMQGQTISDIQNQIGDIGAELDEINGEVV